MFRDIFFHDFIIEITVTASDSMTAMTADNEQHG